MSDHGINKFIMEVSMTGDSDGITIWRHKRDICPPDCRNPKCKVEVGNDPNVYPGDEEPVGDLKFDRKLKPGDMVTFIRYDHFSSYPTELRVSYLWNPITGTGMHVPLGQCKDMIWEEYVKDRDVVREFWRALQERCPNVLEPTAAGPDEDKTRWLVCWDNRDHHVDVDLFLNERPEDHGANEWFYVSRKRPRTALDSEVPSDWEGLIHALTRAVMIREEEPCNDKQ